MNDYLELEQALISSKVKFVEPEYRLYYDSRGLPVSMSSSNHPTGDYIKIDRVTYDKGISSTMRVINNELVIKDLTKFEKQLYKSTTGYRVVKNNPALLLEDHEEYKDIEYYDRNS